MIGNSDDETNFPHKLLLTNSHVKNLSKAFSNYQSPDIKLSKAQLSKMQKSGFLRLLHPLIKSGLPLLKSVIKLLGILGLTAAASAADAGIHKKILGSGHNITLIISNDEMEDILKISKCLEYSGILVKGVSETIKNESIEQRGGSLSMLLGTLGASLLSNMLTGKVIIKPGEGTARVGYGSKKSSLKNFFDSTLSINKL